MEIINKKITELVDENYIYAYVLYYFGIQFYEFSEKTLVQVCKNKGLNVAQVVRSLESINKPEAAPQVRVEELPVDLIIKYLKHNHHIFIKEKLPYIKRLIEKLTPATAPLVKDLQMVFPLFFEDFIHHIYEEEDTLFTYILQLVKARKMLNPSRVYFAMKKHSIQKYALEHDTHDDEMQGIRNITNGYYLDPQLGLHLKVIFAELKSFEKELQLHAHIENEILFPKALLLEKEIQNRLIQISILN